MIKKTDKPWGYEILWAHTNSYAGKEIFIRKGEKLSRQYHNEKEETIYVIEGWLRLELGNPMESVISMCSGSSAHIIPKTIHRMIGITDVKLMEVSTTELDDVVRLEDEYGRVAEEKA